MLRLTIPALAVFAIAIAAFMMRSPSRSIDISTGAAAMPSLQELHAVAGVHKLPVQEMEDQSLVFSAQGKN
ncbi:hypothetical protein [Bradyrhizobium sp. McL0616]|uniref:hypothetical protein n=1 Tax=Bradyrhizobium sp. McL0616 TaxID=3415674 RepID=UPI003CF645D6